MFFGPYPYAPFDGPVIPPDATNQGDFCVTFDKKWIPYLIPIFYTLIAEQTWASDKDRAIGEAQNLIAEIEKQLACIDNTPDTTGIEVDGDCDMKLRYCGGKLQVCDCGTWVDVPSCDGDGGGFEPTQPGGGTGQPDAGGGTMQYCGALSGLQKYLVPTLLSSGDVLLFSKLQGAWNDGVELYWHCPDGWQFVAGSCFENAVYNGGTDPLIGTRHMSIVGEIDGIFYDVLDVDSNGSPTAFTIPAGHTNAQMTLQANVDYGGAIYGEVTFCFDVTNNKALQWSHTWDHTVTPGPWSSESDSLFTNAGLFVPGLGWKYTDQNFSGASWARIVGIQLDPIVFSMDTLDIQFDRTMGTLDSTATSGQNLVLNTSVVDTEAWGTLASGSNQHYQWLVPTAITSRIAVLIGCANRNSVPTTDGDVVITRTTITGHGPDPFA